MVYSKNKMFNENEHKLWELMSINSQIKVNNRQSVWILGRQGVREVTNKIMQKFKVHQGFYFNIANVNALHCIICTRSRDTAVYSEEEQYSEIHLR